MMNLLLSALASFAATAAFHNNNNNSSSRKDSDSNNSNSVNSCWLRIIQINDVYELDAFPHLKTLIDDAKAHNKQDDDDDSSGGGGPDRALVVCAGDFLAPSLLSSLDHGASMVDCLNAVGVDCVCLGNHEADVPPGALRERIARQSNFAWVNSNLRQLNDKLEVDTPEYCIVDIVSSSSSSSSSSSLRQNNDNSNPTQQQQPRQPRRRVALLGLLTEDKGLYRPGAFLGAEIEPVVPCARRLVESLSSSSPPQGGDVDLIVPLTHQSIERDREFCRTFTGRTFPVCLGGHDHEVFDEQHGGSRIVKAGMDAEHAAIVDIRWSADGARNATPVVEAEIVPTRDFAPDPDLQRRVQGHKRILRELKNARLFRLTDWLDQRAGEEIFSTHNNRLGPSTGTTALCSMLRMGMRAQCAIVNAGAVRGNKVYDSAVQEYFAWSDLKAEIPFLTGMTACKIPGRVLEATIAFSRRGSWQTPPAASGGYLHTCRNIRFNDETGKIESICGQPFDPGRTYLTALPAHFFGGIDNHEPLLKWAGEVGDRPTFRESSAIPAKMILVEVFSTLFWLHLGSFDDIDRDQDGVLHLHEVRERVLETFGDEFVADLVVHNLFAVADVTSDGTITPLELMVVRFAAMDLLEHVCTEQEWSVLRDVAASVLNKDPSHADVRTVMERIRDTIDLQGDGKIHREELMKVLGKSWKEKHLLL